MQPFVFMTQTLLQIRTAVDAIERASVVRLRFRKLGTVKGVTHGVAKLNTRYVIEDGRLADD